MSILPGTEARGKELKARVAALEREIEEAPGKTALQQAKARAYGVDRIIAEVIAEAVAETAGASASGAAKADQKRLLPPLRGAAPDPWTRFAVVATGGYGRAELSPRSDVDLVFVLRGKDSSRAFAEKALVEKVLYALWDSGLEIGHSVRTVGECIAVGRADVPARSSLLDHRYVAGDRDLYASFASTLERRLFKIDPAGFVGAKLLEIAKRRERWGAVVSRNEPNLKEGEGGLRDAHTALWISRAVWGLGDAQSLVSRGLARPGDVAEFEAGFERLLHVRSVLHKIAGRKEDRLSFDRQTAVAHALGFAESPRGTATEHFMQSLTQAMAAVQRFLQVVVDRMPDKFHRRAEKMGAFGLAHPRPKPAHGKPARIPKGFRTRRGRLVFADPSSVLESSPAEILRAFTLSATRRLPLHPEARDLVRRGRDRLRESRFHPKSLEAFFELLLHPDGEAVERALLEMNDLGALGAFLPEFEALFYRVQHDTYHVYTSDAHLIIAACNVHRLLAGKWEEGEPALTAIARRLDLRTLILAVFLHDIGKSERGHTEVGLRMLPGIARQLKLSGREHDGIRFLMAEHLLMSHVAQRRDLSDPQTIAAFAAKVQTVERLELLYALTFCDIVAVGPGTWTDWKGALLRELYQRTRAALEGGKSAVLDEQRERARRTREQALALLPRRLPEPGHGHGAALAAFFERLPDRYFATTEPESVIDDFVLSRVQGIRGSTPGAGKGGLKVQGRVLPGRKTTEVTFQAADRPGLFADITGALAAAGLSIRTARIHTALDGMAIDRFEVVGGDGGAVDLQALDRMVRDLLWVLTGKQTAAELLSRRKAPVYARRTAMKAPRVEIHNDASADATVVDVYARDRLGLLHDIAATFTRLSLDIQVALVSTKVDQAADTFYVRNVGGGKVVEPGRLDAIQRELSVCLE